MMFGGYNESQFVGDMYQFPIVTDKWWALDFTCLTYDREVFKEYHTTFEHDQNTAFAVVDTGTSMMAMPMKYFEKLQKRWTSQIGNSTDFKC